MSNRVYSDADHRTFRYRIDIHEVVETHSAWEYLAIVMFIVLLFMGAWYYYLKSEGIIVPHSTPVMTAKVEAASRIEVGPPGTILTMGGDQKLVWVKPTKKFKNDSCYVVPGCMEWMDEYYRKVNAHE